MLIVLVVAVSSHNLVPCAGTIGMQRNIILFYVPKAVNGYCVTWLASIFSPSLPGPYGFHARTQAP